MRRSSPIVVAPAARWRWPGWTAAWPAVVTVAATALLFGLGVANLVIRATWHEADDGVLWVGRVEGVTAFGVAPRHPGGSCGNPAGRPARGDRRPVRRTAVRRGEPPASREGRAAGHLSAAAARDGRGVRLPAGLGPAREHQPVLRAGAGRPVHAARRRRRPPAPAESPGHAALPLALGGVLRLGVVLVQRPPRPARLVLLLGRRGGGAPAAAALPALHVLLPGAPAVVGDQRRSAAGSGRWSTCRRCCSARRASSAIARAASNEQFYIGGVVQALDRFEPLYLSVYLGAGLVVIARAFREVRTVTARRQLRWIAWGTALGGLPFAFGYALPYAMGVVPIAADGAVGDPARA